jgi:cobalt-zinc-cadmium efflux system protein
MTTGTQQQDAGNSQRRGGAARATLIIALLLVVGVMVAEIIGGALSGSLALLADAGHMLASAAAISIALFASWAESRPASIERTFGYNRSEVAGAMLSALALWLVAAWVLFESINRLRDRNDLEVQGEMMLIIGAIGLGVNIVASVFLRVGAQRDQRADEAFQHLVADFLGSVGVVVAAILVMFNGWTIADPIVSIGIAALIAASSWRLILKVFYALMEGTPEHIDLYRLCADIEDVPGVTLIHDVHAWTISEGYHALTAHVVVEPGYTGNTDELLNHMRWVVYQKHGVRHLTLQFEESAADCLEDHHLGHLEARSRFDG